jgi:hypothetical protein
LNDALLVEFWILCNWVGPDCNVPSNSMTLRLVSYLMYFVKLGRREGSASVVKELTLESHMFKAVT